MSLTSIECMCGCGHDDHDQEGCRNCEDCGEFATFADVMAIVAQRARQRGLRLEIVGDPGEELYRVVSDE